MPSQLTAIYAAVAGRTIPVTINGASVNVAAVTGASLPESVESAGMPIRLVTPASPGGRGAYQERHTFKTSASAGGVVTVDWTIQDLFFLRGADAGIGLSDLAPVLTDYAAAYVADLGALVTSRWALTSIAFPAIGGFEWPAESGRYYDGVAVTLTIREII